MIRKSILFAGAALALALIPASLRAQTTETKSAEAKPAEAKPVEHPFYPRPDYSQFATKTYYLANVYQQNDANEILIALRNVLSPYIKIYFVASQNAIVLSAPPEEQALAQKIISDLDRPKKSYRLTFTIAESDAGKRIGVQHFAVILVSDQRTTLKEGSKIPVVTGTFEPSSSSQQSQFQYLDIGMNFDLTLDDSPNGLHLNARIEQSNLADDHMTGLAAQDPIVRQTVLQDSALLTPGKPLTLGSVDIPNSTRHIDIEVIAEPVS